MTKNFKYIISLIVMTTAFAVAASAQLPSLADLGDDVYASDADGFEIAVPEECVNFSDGEGGRNYTCDVKEGRISVSITNDGPPIKTEADVANFLKGFKDTLVNSPDVKMFGETSAKIGSYRGAAYQITLGGDKTLMIALTWGKFVVVITGRANSKVANSADLIGGAVESFKFVSPKTKE
ncbi:MAG: hypothetical protein KA956_07490 [Pyrinomonadaceae bacterium]|nr:hypothetical protein [Acidobacteriota bacterium]MBP7376304.1 hypothetical protein [Pyrinomonadaceae bacterium]